MPLSSDRADRLAAGIAALLCGVALCWALALPLAPLSAASDMRSVFSLAWVPYALGSLICHQLPERSFVSAGVPWPVCGRCAGLYLAGAVGILTVVAGPWRVRHPAAAADLWRAGLMAAALPTLVSWGAERLDWWTPTSATRALLALPLGGAIGAVLAALARAPRPGIPQDLR